MTHTTLLQQLQSADAAQRSQAILTLGKQQAEPAVDALVNILCHDPDLNIQEDATWALVRIGAPATDALLQAIDHREPAVRHNVVHTLGKIGDSRALPALITASQDRDPKVRYKAVYALGQLNDAAAIPAIITCLGDSLTDVQWLARDVLQAFGADALPHLVQAIQSDAVAVRELVADLLMELDSPQALQALITLLDDPAWEVRLAAVQAVGQRGDHSALPDLQRLAHGDPHPQVKIIARQMGQLLDQ